MTTKYYACEHLEDQKSSEYTKQADDFLIKHGITLTISYLKTDKYFDDDKEIRNIFRWQLSKNNKRVWGRFGDSINDTINNVRPSSYDVLACLTKDHPGDFSEFCMSFGYDNDSISALKTWKAVLAEWNKLIRICDETVLSDLREIA